jgi:hypothetical protein
MRYSEFNLTEDELFELKMSPSNLARMAKDIDARAGLEFEMYVPNVDADDEEFESEPDYDADESFPTGRGWTRDVIDFFTSGEMSNSTSFVQRRIDELNHNFYEYVGEQEYEYVNSDAGHERALEIAADNVSEDDFDTTEEYEAALREYLTDNADDISDQLADEFRGDLDSLFEEWLDDQGIGTMADFANEYGLEWPYWTEPESNRGGADMNAVAQDFGDAIGRRVKTGGYHSGAYSQTDNYRIETDSSLSDADDYGDAGLEFVSPPLTIPEMISDIDKVAKWANRVGAYTNSSTGLHMNVSVPGYSMQQLDYVKLAVFLGDNYILERFGREGNTYCRSALNKIKAEVKKDPARLESMLKAMQGELNSIASKIVHTGSTDKYTSINTQSNRVEFRGPGNDWLGEYAADPGTITNTLLRTVVALDIAMKPEAFRQEYMKKLYKVLTPTEFAGARGERQERVVRDTQDVVSLFAKYAAGELPRAALKSFVKQLRLERGKKLPPGSEPPETQTPSRDQEFTGTWEVVSRNTDEVVHTISGIGNVVADAVIHARRWQEQTGFDDPVYVRPQMRPRSGGGFARAPHTSIYQLVNNRNGQIMLGGETRTFADTAEQAGFLMRSEGLTADDVRIVDMYTNTVYDINGRPVGAGSIRATAGEPVPAGSVGGEQSTDANYEIIDLETRGPVFRFIANTDEEAQRKYMDWLNAGDRFIGQYYYRRIEGRGIPGSTAELQRQRAEQSQQPLYLVTYSSTNDDQVINNTISIQAPNADAAMATVRNHLEDAGWRVGRIEAEPAAQTLEPPPEQVDITMPDRNQSTANPPAGFSRWRILDQNDREVYNFIHRSNQGEANVYAANWLRSQGLLGSGEFMVVPAQ